MLLCPSISLFFFCIYLFINIDGNRCAMICNPVVQGPESKVRVQGSSQVKFHDKAHRQCVANDSARNPERKKRAKRSRRIHALCCTKDRSSFSLIILLVFVASRVVVIVDTPLLLNNLPKDLENHMRR